MVYNDQLLKDKNAGEEVKVIYDFTKKCLQKEGKPVCLLYHESKGTIMIKSLQ